MLKYGARRRGYGSWWVTTRKSYTRSNAGRNRSTKAPHPLFGMQSTRGFLKTDNNQGNNAIARGMSKRTRFSAKLDIRSQVDDVEQDKWSESCGVQFTDPMWWHQEEEILKQKGPHNHRHYVHTIDEAWSWYDDYMSMDDGWGMEGYSYADYLADRDAEDVLLDDDYDDYEYDCMLAKRFESGKWDPTEPMWKDLWVDGKVDTPELYEFENGLDDPYYWCDDCDGLYSYQEDEQDFFAAGHFIKEVPYTEDPAYDRDMERHLAGERFFKQHGRTTSKGLITQRSR